MKIYSVYDNKSETWGIPWFQPTDIQAARIFSMRVNHANEDNQQYTHPDDFDLYRIGEWSDETGVMETQERVKILTGIKAKT